MPREISDEEFNYLQSRRQVADFVESIYNDPQLSKDAKRLIKKKYPNLQIPDFDIEEKVEARFAERDKKEQETAAERQKREQDERWQSERTRVKEQYGFTDEAMGRLEKMMVDRSIGNYEDAAELMASREPKPSEAEDYDPTRWNHDKQQGFAEIAKDPEAWGRQEILKSLRAEQAAARSAR